jgi:hypothetical protein
MRGAGHPAIALLILTSTLLNANSIHSSKMIFMKHILLLSYMLFITVLIFGQAKEGTVKFQRTQQPAAVIELPYSPDMVRAAMNDYLSKKGKSKGNDLKGFTTFRNTQLLQHNADLYFRVERKNNQENGNATVSLLLTSPKAGNENMDNLHYLNMEQAKIFLNDLAPAIEAYNLEQQIKDQNEAVIKAESKYKSLATDGTDLERKRAGIEKQQQGNKQDQQTQMTEIENQKQKLAVLVNQRKS